jgi:hypothetical protein
VSSPPPTEALHRLLRELSDRQASTDLILGIGALLDEKRFEDARALFTADVTVTTPGGSATGIEAVFAQARGNHAVTTQHQGRERSRFL